MLYSNLTIQFGNITAIPAEPSRSRFRAYPNPVKDRLILDLAQDSPGQKTWVLTDMRGSVLLTGTFKGKQCTIDAASVPEGNCLLSLHAGNEVHTEILVIRH